MSKKMEDPAIAEISKIRETPELREIYEVMKKLSEDAALRARYDSLEKAIWDKRARFYGARAEGIKEGKLEGIKEGKLEGIKEGRKLGKLAGIKEGRREMARKFLKMGLSAAQVAQGTTLTIEEVQSLRNEIDASPAEV
jgi:predicted transposase YdaD